MRSLSRTLPSRVNNPCLTARIHGDLSNTRGCGNDVVLPPCHDSPWCLGLHSHYRFCGVPRARARFSGTLAQCRSASLSLRGPRIASTLVERRRELTAADVMRDFALVHGNVATTGDRSREHVEKTSVARLLKMSVSVVVPYYTPQQHSSRGQQLWQHCRVCGWDLRADLRMVHH